MYFNLFEHTLFVGGTTPKGQPFIAVPNTQLSRAVTYAALMSATPSERAGFLTPQPPHTYPLVN